MFSILDLDHQINNPGSLMTLTFLSLAVFRIYLEAIKYDLSRLPVSELMAKKVGINNVRRWHKMGFYFSLGYFTLFAPTFLLN